mmetsp:Transcript_29798/g.90187  ORF Transcript_29798/g.90187 Transcript_29798/m.90187 type:complete len:208 (-) Transcript_29798:653-1276(-)
MRCFPSAFLHRPFARARRRLPRGRSRKWRDLVRAGDIADRLRRWDHREKVEGMRDSRHHAARGARPDAAGVHAAGRHLLRVLRRGHVHPGQVGGGGLPRGDRRRAEHGRAGHADDDADLPHRRRRVHRQRQRARRGQLAGPGERAHRVRSAREARRRDARRPLGAHAHRRRCLQDPVHGHARGQGRRGVRADGADSYRFESPGHGWG